MKIQEANYISAARFFVHRKGDVIVIPSDLQLRVYDPELCFLPRPRKWLSYRNSKFATWNLIPIGILPEYQDSTLRRCFVWDANPRLTRLVVEFWEEYYPYMVFLMNNQARPTEDVIQETNGDSFMEFSFRRQLAVCGFVGASHLGKPCSHLLLVDTASRRVFARL